MNAKTFIAGEDLLRTARHEAGHYIVARHFGLAASLSTSKNSRGGKRERHYFGQVMFEPTTSFRFSVIGWAGPLGEEMKDGDGLAGDDLLDYFETTMILMPGEFSSSDERNILGTPYRWRACKLARKILSDNWQELDRIVEGLVKQYVR